MGTDAVSSRKAQATERAARSRARAAIRAARRRARLRLLLFTAGGAAIVITLVVALMVTTGGPGGTRAVAGIPATPAATATGRTSTPPWSAPADVAAAVKAAGLPMLNGEGNVEHIHAHLDVIVDGQAVTVPADIGVDDRAATISPLHSHDTTGVLHIESPVKADFSLGQFFTQWQVALAAGRIGGLTDGGGRTLRAYVNGALYQGDPAGIVLHAHDEVALVYGTAAQQANPPSGYAFEAGE